MIYRYRSASQSQWKVLKYRSTFSWSLRSSFYTCFTNVFCPEYTNMLLISGGTLQEEHYLKIDSYVTGVSFQKTVTHICVREDSQNILGWSSAGEIDNNNQFNHQTTFVRLIHLDGAQRRERERNTASSFWPENRSFYYVSIMSTRLTNETFSKPKSCHSLGFWPWGCLAVIKSS